MKSRTIMYAFGILLVALGTFMSISLKDAHFYTPFAIGFLIIVLNIYNSLSKKPLFRGWRASQYAVFSAIIILSSIVIDKIGMSLGYWNYPSFATLFDEILKYLFEWAAPFVYVMVVFLIGLELSNRLKIRNPLKIIISLIMVTAVGFLTDFVNSFTHSWQILSMPVINYNFRGYFLLFETLGYWTMGAIALLAYIFADRRLK